MHAAIYDAVTAIDGTHEPYAITLPGTSPDASQDAAAAAAAHEVLVALYPTFQMTLDAELQASLAQVPDGAGKTQGVSIGQTVADRILALRSDDGSNAEPPPFVFGTAPGDYQSTPPNFPPQPQFTHWSGVTPFALKSASQFRPGPPPAVTSHAYSAAFNEVMSLGIASSTAATADQALTGQFWNGAIQNYWNEIAQTASVAHELSTAQNARLFALLNLSLADGVIAFYDAKYTYTFWRPVTAIRAADTDGNAHTVANPTWLPEVTNTHSGPVLSGRARGDQRRRGGRVDRLLRAGSVRLRRHVGSPPGRGAFVHEILCRRTGGDVEPHLCRVHFRFDLITGGQLGRHVAKVVDDNLLRSVGHHG